MPCKHSFPIAMAVMLAMMVAFSPWPAIADMPVTFLDVEPVAGASYGWGFNLTTKQFTAPCLNYNTNATYTSGDPNQGTVFEFVENTSEIASQSNLTVSASLKVLAMGGTYKLDNKTEVAGGTESSTYSQSLFANAYRYNIPKFLEIGQVSFRPQILQVLTTPGGKGQFKQQCGDAFVIGIQTGREFIGTATVMKQTLKNWTKFANETGASASGPWGSASASVNIGQTMQQAFGSNNIIVRTYSTGSNTPSPTLASELTNYYKTFLNSSGPEKTVKIIVAPYQLVPNYPWENPLEGNTKDDYIGMMVVGLWELKAAIRDANFIIDPTTVNMFALGSNANIKNQRITYIRQLRGLWQREYDLLLKAAQKCDQNFTSQCKSLAEFYERNRNLNAQWLAVLPERYLSDCYQSMTLTGGPSGSLSQLKDKLMAPNNNFGTQVYGDSETGGTPSRVAAELTFKPDQSQLKAYLSVMKMEWHGNYRPRLPIAPQYNKPNHFSTWGLQAQATVFDLESPARYIPSLSNENLKHCTWRGTGVQSNNIQTPNAFQPLHRFGFSQRYTHGYIDGLSGKDPRGQVHYGNGSGVLDYIKCEVDRKGKDNNMTCQDLGVRNVALLLDSKQDLAANRWVRPSTPPQVPTALTNFDRGQTITAVNMTQFQPLTATLTATQKSAVNTANTQRSKAMSKFKTKSYKLPSSQLNLIQMRLKAAPGAKSLQTPVKK